MTPSHLGHHMSCAVSGSRSRWRSSVRKTAPSMRHSSQESTGSRKLSVPVCSVDAGQGFGDGQRCLRHQTSVEQVESVKDCLLGSHSSYIKGRVKLSTSPSTAPDRGQVGSGSISRCRAKTKSSFGSESGQLVWPARGSGGAR